MSFSGWGAGNSGGGSVSGTIIVNDGYFGDGSAAAPSIHFTQDPTTGLFRAGTGDIGITASGTKVAEFKTTGLTLPTGNTVDLGAGAVLSSGSSALLITVPGNGLIINGGIASLASATGFAALGSGYNAWVKQAQSGMDARVMGNPTSGQNAVVVGTSKTDAANGQAATLFAVATDTTNTPQVKMSVDGYGLISAKGTVASPNTASGIAYDCTPTGAGSLITAYKARNDSITTYADWGQAGTGVYSFANTTTAGADFRAPLVFRNPVAGASFAPAASLAAFKYTTGNRVNPQISTDGYSFQDPVTGLAKYKSADQPIAASTTLVDDTDLNFGTLDAGSRYIIEACIFATNSSTGGVKVDLAGTAGIQTLIADLEILDLTATGINKAGRLTALGSGGVLVSATSGDNQDIWITGSIQVTTAGTLKIQIAQGSAAGTTTFKAGSWARLHKI